MFIFSITKHILIFIAITQFILLFSKYTDWGPSIINRILFNPVDALNNLFCRYFHRMKEVKALKISGPAVIAPTHKCGMDVCYTFALVDGQLRFIMDSAFMKIPLFGSLCKRAKVIPVNFKNRQQRAMVVKIAAEALASGEIIAIYPYGGLYFKKGKDRGLQIRDGIARIVLEAQELLKKRNITTNIPVYPVHYEGVNTKALGKLVMSFFYRGNIKAHIYEEAPIFISSHKEIDSFMEKIKHFIGPENVVWKDKKHTVKKEVNIIE